jgi:hypothetical protein
MLGTFVALSRNLATRIRGAPCFTRLHLMRDAQNGKGKVLRYCWTGGIPLQVFTVPIPIMHKTWEIPTPAKPNIHSVLSQPRHGFLAVLETKKFSPGELHHVLRKRNREAFGSHPCGFLDIGLVEDCAFLHGSNCVLVKRRSSEIGKDQD